MSDVLQMYPRATPDQPAEPSREMFAAGKIKANSPRAREWMRLRGKVERAREAYRNYGDHGSEIAMIRAEMELEDFEARTWTPTGGGAA